MTTFRLILTGITLTSCYLISKRDLHFIYSKRYDLPPQTHHSLLTIYSYCQTLWENLRNSVTKYCDQSAYHSQALLYTTKNIVVQFADTSSVKYEAPPTAARVPSGGT